MILVSSFWSRCDGSLTLTPPNTIIELGCDMKNLTFRKTLMRMKAKRVCGVWYSSDAQASTSKGSSIGACPKRLFGEKSDGQIMWLSPAISFIGICLSCRISSSFQELASLYSVQRRMFRAPYRVSLLQGLCIDRGNSMLRRWMSRAGHHRWSAYCYTLKPFHRISSRCWGRSEPCAKLITSTMKGRAFDGVFTKLAAWGLTGYDKVLLVAINIVIEIQHV